MGSIYRFFNDSSKWWKRLIQWPLLSIAMVVMACITAGMCAIVALSWPFYDWDQS